MTRFRRFLFWIHLAAGVTAGLVILVLSVTGAALALKPQILRAIDTAGVSVSADGRQPLTAAALVNAIRQTHPEVDVRAVTLQRDATAPASAQVGPATVYLDPYSGAVLGQPSQQALRAFRAIENWHRWFALQGDWRQAGRAITGVANAVFLLLALTGLWLWAPRQWTLRHLRPIAFFRRSSTPKARDFNWHNVAGIWSLPMIVVMTITGLLMSYPVLNRQLQQALGGAAPERVEGGGRVRPGMADDANRARAESIDGLVLDAAVADLQRREPHWQVISADMTRVSGGTLTVSAATGGSLPAARSQLVVNPITAEVVRWQPASIPSTLAQRVRLWVRFGHTGELWGVAGQILAGLSCLGGALLVWSGLSLAGRRLTAFMRRLALVPARQRARADMPDSGHPMAGYAEANYGDGVASRQI